MATAETTDTNISNSVTWSVDAQGVGETAQINRDWPNEKTDSTAVIRTAKAQLGKVCPQIRSQTIRVCRWPKLKLKLVDFICEEVNNDGYTLCTQVFDRKWIEGRAQPKAYNTPDATKCQSVLCFVGGGTIKLSAKFTVLQVPTDSEKVKITGTAVFGGINLKWEQEVTVNPGDKEVTFTEIHSDNPLNAGVATGAPLKISWTATAPTVLYADGSTDEPEKIGESENLSYVVLKKNPVELKTNPTKIVRYWTLLEVSCRGANGKTTENDFVPAAFAPFKLSTGDNKGMQRMGDGERLSYYKHGDETVATADVYTALGILSSADGTGRCGGWADVLIHLFNMHGVDSATKYALVRYYKKTLTNTDRTLRFLVKNCTLPATTNIHAAPYRNFGNTLSKTDGVSGQGKTNPQFDFSDHVTVKHNGQIYDPSYGIGPYNSTYEYEQAAIEGYALYPNGVGQYQCTGKYDKLRISKFISDECLYTHITDNGDTLLSIAAKYQNTLTNQLRRLNPSLQANKDDDPLPVATEVYVILHRTGAVLYWT
jgi:hypothetical protein